MWGNHLLSRFFWLVKCPKSSTKQILNANGKILTLWAWQRSNRIIYQHKDLSFKSNQVKRDEMTWYEMQGFFTKMIRNDMKGCKRIKDVNRTEYLQRTLHQNDRSPFLDVAGANTCNSIWPFLVCLRSGMAKKFKVSFWYVKFHNILYSRTCWRDSIFLWFMNKDHSILPKLVPEVYGLHPHAAYRAKKKQISDFFSFRYFAGGWCLSFTCTKPWKGAAVNFFVWQFSIETFPCSMPALQNLAHQPKAPFTSQGSQDLVKLLPHWGSFTFRL